MVPAVLPSEMTGYIQNNSDLNFSMVLWLESGFYNSISTLGNYTVWTFFNVEFPFLSFEYVDLHPPPCSLLFGEKALLLGLFPVFIHSLCFSYELDD